jgi:hypothetical protein
VVAVGGGDESPPVPWLQVMLAHETSDFLGIDDDTTVAQLDADPAIAVGLGLRSSAMTSVAGASSCNSSSRFGPSSAFNVTTPVACPDGQGS